MAHIRVHVCIVLQNAKTEFQEQRNLKSFLSLSQCVCASVGRQLPTKLGIPGSLSLFRPPFPAGVSPHNIWLAATQPHWLIRATSLALARHGRCWEFESVCYLPPTRVPRAAVTFCPRMFWCTAKSGLLRNKTHVFHLPLLDRFSDFLFTVLS